MNSINMESLTPSGRMRRWPYGATIREFLVATPDAIIGALVSGADFSVETAQRNAWQHQVQILKDVLADCSGRGAVYFEFAIPALLKNEWVSYCQSNHRSWSSERSDLSGRPWHCTPLVCG